MNGNTIGDRIKAIREGRNETQAVLADALHVKRQTVDQWENGKRDLKTQYTVDLANHFGITCDELLRGVKAGNVDIHEKTGLCDSAIENLAGYKKLKESSGLDFIDVVNGLFSKGEFMIILGQISKYNKLVRQGNTLADAIEDTTAAFEASLEDYSDDDSQAIDECLKKELEVKRNAGIRIKDTFGDIKEKQMAMLYGIQKDFILMIEKIAEEVANDGQHNQADE